MLVKQCQGSAKDKFKLLVNLKLLRHIRNGLVEETSYLYKMAH